MGGGVFQNRIRKHEETADEVSNQDNGVPVLDSTDRLDDLSSSSRVSAEESLGKVHLDQEYTKDCAPSKRKTSKTPKKKSGSKIIALPFGSKGVDKKKKKKGKKKGKNGKKKKTKDTITTQASQDFEASTDGDKLTELNAETLSGHNSSSRSTRSSMSFRSNFFRSTSLYSSMRSGLDAKSKDKLVGRSQSDAKNGSQSNTEAPSGGDSSSRSRASFRSSLLRSSSLLSMLSDFDSKSKDTVSTDLYLSADFQSSNDIDRVAEYIAESPVQSVPSSRSPSSRSRPSFRSSFLRSGSLLSLMRSTSFSSKHSRNTLLEDEPPSPFNTHGMPVSPRKPKNRGGRFTLRDQMKRDFSSVFNNVEEETEDQILVDDGQQQQELIDKLMNELQNCEITMKKEREEMSKDNADMRLKLNSVEQLLNMETLKNEELHKEIQELQERESAKLEELREKNRILETENEHLQQKTEQQQETISSLMITEKTSSSGRFKFPAVPEMSHMLPTAPLNSISTSLASQGSKLASQGSKLASQGSKLASQGGQWVAPSAIRRKFRPPPRISSLVLNEEGAMEMRMLVEDDGDDTQWSEEESGFMSIASMPHQAQGELLQLRSTLRCKSKILEDQTKALAEVQQELEDLKEEEGVKNLTSYVKNLENEKEFFVSEIDKLKKELNESRKRESVATSKIDELSSAPPPSKPLDRGTSGSSWFGFGATVTPSILEESDSSEKDDDEFRDIVSDLNGSAPTRAHSVSIPTVNDLNGATLARAHSVSIPLSENVSREESSRRLDRLMDF